MIEVVAALIWQNGKFMICRRPKRKARGGLYEFVGGKVESGEDKKSALVRECKEELAVTVRPKEEFMKVIHEYPDITIELTVYNAEIIEGEPQLIEHEDIKWIKPCEIENYAFCPADKDILAKIKEEAKA